jgi:hypothetical protein
VSVGNSNAITLKNDAGITVASGGTMTVTGNNKTHFDNNQDDGIIENWGTFQYSGTAGNTDGFDMPLLNHGSATFSGGEIDFNRGAPATDGYGVKMDQGSITLDSQVTLNAGQEGYEQTGGSFTARDQGSKLRVNTIAEFDGGTLSFGTSTAFGKLTVTGGNVNLNGVTVKAKIAGGGGSQDELVVGTNGKLTIEGQSSLTVTAVGAVVTGKTWDIITVIDGTTFTDFPGGKTLPGGVSLNLNKLTNGLYELTS